MRSTSASQAVQPLPSPHRPRFVCPSLTGWHKRCPNSASFFTCARPIVAKAGSTNQEATPAQDQQRLRPVPRLPFFSLSSTIDTALLPSIPARNLPIIGVRISSRLAWPLHLCASPPSCPCRRPCREAKTSSAAAYPSPPYGPRALTDHKGAWA